MLGSHPAIAAPPETLFFTHLWPWRSLYGNSPTDQQLRALVEDSLSLPRLQWLKGQLDPREVASLLKSRTLGGVFDAILSAWTRKQGKQTWAESTPSHAFQADAIREQLPEVVLVHLLRDGRDVALSLKKARFGPATLPFAARRWSKSVQQARRVIAQCPIEKGLEVRYEDLVADPVVALTAICHKMGLEFSPEMLEYHRKDKGEVYFKEELAGIYKKPYTDSVGRWQRELEPAQVEQIESLVGPALRDCGYDCPERETPTLYQTLGWLLNEAARKPIRMAQNLPGQKEALVLLSLRVRQLVRFCKRSRV